jgi:hypothetical protein
MPNPAEAVLISIFILMIVMGTKEESYILPVASDKKRGNGRGLPYQCRLKPLISECPEYTLPTGSIGKEAEVIGQIMIYICFPQAITSSNIIIFAYAKDQVPIAGFSRICIIKWKDMWMFILSRKT